MGTKLQIHGYETVETWVQNRRSETDKRVKHIKRLRKKAKRLKNAWKIRKIEGKKIKYSTKTYPSQKHGYKTVEMN